MTDNRRTKRMRRIKARTGLTRRNMNWTRRIKKRT
jgi:hypothetical protein